MLRKLIIHYRESIWYYLNIKLKKIAEYLDIEESEILIKWSADHPLKELTGPYNNTRWVSA